MEAIKIFDEKFKEKNSYYALGCNLAKYVCLFISLPLMAVLPDIGEENFAIAIYITLIISFTVNMHLKPYLCIKQGQLTIPYFKVMRDIPISRKDFIRSRTTILIKFVTKYAVACLLINILSSIYLVDNPSLENTLFYAFWIIMCMLLITGDCIYEIHRKTRF